MKKVFMVLGIIVAVLIMVIGLLFFAVGVSESETAMAIFGFIIFAISLILMIRSGVKNSKTEENKEKRRKYKEKVAENRAKYEEKYGREHFFITSSTHNIKYKFTHVLGLPIMEGAVCNVVSEHDKIIIEAQGTVLSLNKERITYIGKEKNIQKYSQAISSVGGAIAGGMLFGGIGAAIGGSATSRNFQSKKQYLIITYIGKDATVKYVVFDYIPKAENLIRDFKLFNKSNLRKLNVEIE